MKYILSIVMKNGETIKVIATKKDMDNLQDAIFYADTYPKVVYWIDNLEINAKDIKDFYYAKIIKEIKRDERMKIDDREFEIIFTMKDDETICVKASKNDVDNVYKLHRDLEKIKGNIILDFDGKLIDLKEVDYFRWYLIYWEE